MMTAGIDALPDNEKAAVLSKVRTFNAFDRENDPHGEHDRPTLWKDVARPPATIPA